MSADPILVFGGSGSQRPDLGIAESPRIVDKRLACGRIDIMCSDPQEIQGIIGAIYEAGRDPFHWPTALTRLRRETSADFVCLAYLDFFDFRGSVWHAGGDKDFFQGFVRQFGQRDNPFMEHYRASEPGTIVAREDVLDDEAWRNSAVYRELFEPAGMGDVVGVCLVQDSDALAMIRLVRATCAGQFSSQDLDTLSTLIPHLQGAMRIHGRIHGLRRDRATLTRAMDQLALGVVTLDDQGRVIWINETARAMLSRGDGLVLHGDDELATVRPKDTERLSGFIRSAVDPEVGEGGAVAIQKSSSAASYAVLVEPLFESTEERGPLVRGAAVVFLMDPEVKPGGTRAAFRALYDLTDAEASIAAEIAAGRSRAEIAERLGVSVHTVRFHLTHIFAKTGTTRQAELTSLLLRSGPGKWAS